MKSFHDKVASITGASSGIGRALAVELSKRGCHLSLSDINVEGLAETAERARGTGVTVTTQELDVSDREAVHAWADATARDHGRVNLVFNNAGVALGSTVEGVTYEDLEWIMNINFWGVVHGTKAFLPHLHASGDGHVVNISSLFGLIAAPGNGAYNATKFAVRGFTEALRSELELTEAKVSATSVHPGGIKTNIARSSRVSDSIKTLVADPAGATARFEKTMLITAPSEAAKIILRGVETNARRVLVGRDAQVLDFLARVAPTGVYKLTQRLARRMAR